jgi:hypothetical protein
MKPSIKIYPQSQEVIPLKFSVYVNTNFLSKFILNSEVSDKRVELTNQLTNYMELSTTREATRC